MVMFNHILIIGTYAYHMTVMLSIDYGEYDQGVDKEQYYHR